MSGRRGCIFLLIFCGLFLLCISNNPTFAAEYEYKETIDLVNFVRDAAVLVEKEGERTFPQFRQRGGKWFQGDKYVFIWEINGLRIVYPPDPNGEGKNMLDLKDVNGKPIGRMFIEKISGKNIEAWCHYQWPRPNDIIPVWKSTFIKRVYSPSGRTYVIGSGLYEMKTEKKFIVDLVNEAAELFKKEGSAAFERFRDKSSEFIFYQAYLFVDDDKGVSVFNAATPSIEGKNLFDYKDSNGKYFVREFIEITKTRDSAWVDYMWPKPGESAPSKKTAYIKRIRFGKDVFIIGSGIYFD